MNVVVKWRIRFWAVPSREEEKVGDPVQLTTTNPSHNDKKYIVQGTGEIVHHLKHMMLPQP